MNHWISIDFGTCNTAAAIEVEGKPHLVTYGNYQYFPTVACIMPDGNIQVCQNAEPLRKNSPESYLQEFKLQIAEQLDMNSVQYVDVVCEILKFVKGCAEIENNGEKLDSVVLTVPSMYSDGDRRIEIMRRAASKAGFINIEFLSEANAAANHYANIVRKKNTGISLIYNLGGGTFDPTLIDLSDSHNPVILGKEAGLKCGGQYFDAALYKFISNKVKVDAPLDRSKRIEDYQACKRLKESLSILETASQYFSNGKSVSVTREEFYCLIKDKIHETFEACDSMLHTAQKSWTDVRQVLFVGGSTAIPLIKESLENHLASHNATSVEIIRNLTGKNGSYDYHFATCLGGIVPKIAPPPPPPELIAVIEVNDTALQLKQGINTFGRSKNSDFPFQDDYMSRIHFEINATKDAYGHWNYKLTNKSPKGTVLNNIELLIEGKIGARNSAMLQDRWTFHAGKTKFSIKKLSVSDISQ